MRRTRRTVKRISPPEESSDDDKPLKKKKSVEFSEPTAVNDQKSKKDDSSSESDLETYLKSADQIDLTSSFFQTQEKQSSSFDTIEKDIFSGIKCLSDSGSESEDTKQNDDSSDNNVGANTETLEHQFHQLHAYNKKLEEAKEHVERYKAKKLSEESKLDVLSLLTQGEARNSGPSTNDVYSSLNSSEFESMSESEKEDWEEVHTKEEKTLIPKDGVEVTVKMPEVIRKKKGLDLMAALKRRLNRIKKENQVYLHQVHLLCWIAHGNYVNKILISENLWGLALSVLPSQHCYPSKRIDLTYLEQILKWYRKAIKLPDKPAVVENQPLEESLQAQINKREAYDYKMYVYIFICILRSLGVKTRLVLSLQVQPLRPPSMELCSLSKEKTPSKSSGKVCLNKPKAKVSTPKVSRRKSEVKLEEKKNLNISSEDKKGKEKGKRSTQIEKKDPKTGRSYLKTKKDETQKSNSVSENTKVVSQKVERGNQKDGKVRKTAAGSALKCEVRKDKTVNPKAGDGEKENVLEQGDKSNKNLTKKVSGSKMQDRHKSVEKEGSKRNEKQKRNLKNEVHKELENTSAEKQESNGDVDTILSRKSSEIIGEISSKLTSKAASKPGSKSSLKAKLERNSKTTCDSLRNSKVLDTKKILSTEQICRDNAKISVSSDVLNTKGIDRKSQRNLKKCNTLDQKGKTETIETQDDLRINRSTRQKSKSPSTLDSKKKKTVSGTGDEDEINLRRSARLSSKSPTEVDNMAEEAIYDDVFVSDSKLNVGRSHNRDLLKVKLPFKKLNTKRTGCVPSEDRSNEAISSFLDQPTGNVRIVVDDITRFPVVEDSVEGDFKIKQEEIETERDPKEMTIPQVDGTNDTGSDTSTSKSGKPKPNLSKLKMKSEDPCPVKTHLKRLKTTTQYKEVYSDEDFRSKSSITKKNLPSASRPLTKKSVAKKLQTPLDIKLSNLRKLVQSQEKSSNSPHTSSDSDRSRFFGNSPSKKSVDVRNDIINLVKKGMTRQKEAEHRKMVKHKRLSNKYSDDDSDYAPESVKKKCVESEDFKEKQVRVKRRVPTRKDIIEADRIKKEEKEEEKRKKGVNIWAEVFAEAEEKWISVDVVKGQVHCVNELFTRATQPVCYILAWDDNNCIKDITKRYCVNWNTVTRKLRIGPAWWDATLRPFLCLKTPRDREEDEELERQQLEKPLPTTISEYKDHPLYVLKRHLLKFQAIYPPDAVTLGFIKNEPVYSRDCVYVLHSRELWLKEAKVVKAGEQPYKIVKARPKWDKLSNTVITDKPLEIFGIWQVEDYVPPAAENGIVPRNAYGNVELFKPCMLPKGTVHLQLPSLNKVARKLNVDCAPAVVGFDFHAGWNHAVYDGFIVCEEHADKLVAAWCLEQEEAEKRAQEKLEKRVYDNWRKLIKGLLIRERLKARYDFGAPSRETKGSKCKKKGGGSKLGARKPRITSDNDSESE